MHLETIQHLRSVAGHHDDLVPIAKPLLLDLLDSYERHELRSLNASVRIVGAASEKHAEQMLLLAQFCQCEVSYTDGGNGEDYFLSHGTQQLRLSARANKADGAFLRIQARPSESEDLPAAPAADPDNLPNPADQRRLRYQPHWSVREMDAIDELSRLKDLEPVAIVRQALRHYHLAHADLKHPAAMPADVLTANEETIAQLEASLGTIAQAAHMIIGAYDPRFFRAGAWAQAALQACQEQFPCKAVNEVTPVNPVTSPQPADDTRHTIPHCPGHPCPVDGDVEVLAFDGRDWFGPFTASTFDWSANRAHSLGANIIGWAPALPSQQTDIGSASETFEAHGHTWTRHTPGDPCPVADPDALVYVLTSFGGPSQGAPSRAGLCGWHVAKHHNYAWGEIIGWRYATPSTENPA